MELSDDETTMVIKFRRKTIKQALAEKGETIDIEFEVRGTFQIGQKTCIFTGIDTIMKILAESVPSKNNK